MGHCGRIPFSISYFEVYNFLSTIFDFLLLILLLLSTLQMLFLFSSCMIFTLSDASMPICFYFFLDRRVFDILLIDFFLNGPHNSIEIVSQTYDPILDGQIDDSCSSKMVSVCISIVDVLSSDLLNSRLLYCCVRTGDFPFK